MYPWIKLNVDQLFTSPVRPVSIAAFLVLASHMDEDGYASMSYRSLGRTCGYSRRAVIDALAELERHGWLERTNTVARREPLSVRVLAIAAVGSATPIPLGGEKPAQPPDRQKSAR